MTALSGESKHPKKAVLRSRRSFGQTNYVAQWVGGKRGYLWLGTLNDDGYERYVLSLSMGQAKALHRLLDAEFGRKESINAS